MVCAAVTSQTLLMTWPRLYSDHLPELDRVRELIGEYFAVFHSLRCFGFLHKPTVTQRLDNDSAWASGNALLHIVCSLGAKQVST